VNLRFLKGWEWLAVHSQHITPEKQRKVQTLINLIRDTKLVHRFGARFEEREQKGLTSNEIHGNVDIPETCGKLRQKAQEAINTAPTIFEAQAQTTAEKRGEGVSLSRWQPCQDIWTINVQIVEVGKETDAIDQRSRRCSPIEELEGINRGSEASKTICEQLGVLQSTGGDT